MFGSTGNNNGSSGSGGGGGFGFNLGGNKPTTSGFGTSSSNIFSTPSNTNNNTGASAAGGGGGVPPKPASTAFAFGTPTAGGSGAGGSSTSLFGTAASKPETSKPAGGFSFGTSSAGSSSLFDTSKPSATPFGANTTSAPAASASGSMFGTTNVAPSTSGGGLGFSGFGTASAAAPVAETKPAAPFSLASAAPSTSGGGLGFSGFGTASAATPFSLASAASSTAAANPTSGTGFGGFKLSTAPAIGVSSAAAAATTSGEQSTSILSKASTVSTTEKAGDEASKKDSSVDLANAALRGKTLEEIAQMWTSELATQTRAFHTQANTVGYWDRALVQQGKRITGLYEATMGVEAEQAALDQSLEHMEGQQTALQNLLDTYEGRIQDIVHKTATRPPGAKGVAMTADEERDHVYSSAERLNTQLDELARRLTTLVEDVNGISNASSSATADADAQRADPFAQIVEILNAHLTSLEWVDSQTTQLQDRVKTAQRVYQDVASAQSSLTGAYGGVGAADSYGDDVDLAASGESMPTIPGAFVNDPAAPPATSSFGTPRGNLLRRPQGSSLGNRGQQGASVGAAPQSPFANAFQRRGF